MILVFGSLANPSVALLLTRLTDRTDDVLLLDARQHPEGFLVEGQRSDEMFSGRIRYADRELPWADVHSIYIHQIDAPPWQVACGSSGFTQRMVSTGAWLLATLASAFEGLVVNRPVSCLHNSSKALQQVVIARHGFSVPRTLVTTCPTEARRFYEDCGRNVIYKAIGHHRSIVRPLLSDDLERLERVRVCPTMLQERIAGVDQRVHVVGDRVFATEVSTDATDYRYFDLDGSYNHMQATELPADVGEQCVLLTRAVGLEVSGIDLRRGTDGRYWCFEVNPAPGFAYYELRTGQPIAASIGDLLCSPGAVQPSNRLPRRRWSVAEMEDDEPRSGCGAPLSSAVYSRREGVQWTVVDGQGVLVDLESDNYFSLNRSATVVWECLAGQSLAHTVEAICARFDVPREVAGADVQVLVERLVKENLICPAI